MRFHVGEFKNSFAPVKVDAELCGHIHVNKEGYQYRPKNSTKRWWTKRFLNLDTLVAQLRQP